MPNVGDRPRLTPSQHDALVYLAEVKHASTRAVANYLGTRLASGHNVLNHLADKGLARASNLGPFEGLRWEPTGKGLRALGYTVDLRVTVAQADEVRAMLEAQREAQVRGDRSTGPWGSLEGTCLTVTDRPEATADLRVRARQLDEAEARMLNGLADKVAMPGPAGLARLMTVPSRS